MTTVGDDMDNKLTDPERQFIEAMRQASQGVNNPFRFIIERVGAGGWEIEIISYVCALPPKADIGTQECPLCAKAIQLEARQVSRSCEFSPHRFVNSIF